MFGPALRWEQLSNRKSLLAAASLDPALAKVDPSTLFSRSVASRRQGRQWALDLADYGGKFVGILPEPGKGCSLHQIARQRSGAVIGFTHGGDPPVTADRSLRPDHHSHAPASQPTARAH